MYKNIHVPKMQHSTSKIFFFYICCPFVPLTFYRFVVLSNWYNLWSNQFNWWSYGLIGGLISQIGGLIGLISGLIGLRGC